MGLSRSALDEGERTVYNDVMTDDTTHVPGRRLRFTCVNAPVGRPEQDRVHDVPADRTTIGTILNYDYAAGVAPGREAPVGTVVTVEQPGGYVRTWTLLGVDE